MGCLLVKNDLTSSFKEFKPALSFLLVFAFAYFIGNMLYGAYVEYYKPRPDPVSFWVTSQSAFLLTVFSEPVQAYASKDEPIVMLANQKRTVLRVFEGCNGLNVMIVFLSFVVAFGGKTKHVIVFLFMGFLLIHIVNLVRILLLYYTALYRPSFFYYFHKYFFTAMLYLIVFALWFAWIEWTRIKSGNKDVAKA